MLFGFMSHSDLKLHMKDLNSNFRALTSAFNRPLFSTISFPQRSKRKPDATVYIDFARCWWPRKSVQRCFSIPSIYAPTATWWTCNWIPHAILGSWSASTSILCGASTDTSRRLLKSCRILYGAWPGGPGPRSDDSSFFKSCNSPVMSIGMGCKEKKSCGGMKMRNENQVSVNQNYLPSKKMTTSE